MLFIHELYNFTVFRKISRDNLQIEIRTLLPLHLEERILLFLIILSINTDKKVGNTTPFIYKKVVPVLVNPALQFNYNKISRLVLSKLSGIQRINKSVYAFTCTFAKIRFQKRIQKESKKRIQKESDQ